MPMLNPVSLEEEEEEKKRKKKDMEVDIYLSAICRLAIRIGCSCRGEN